LPIKISAIDLTKPNKTPAEASSFTGANNMPKSKIIVGPTPQANWEIPILRPRFLTSEFSEMYVQDAGTPTPTEIPVIKNPVNNIGKFTVNIIMATPNIYTNIL